jgi:hypothetical protein
VIRSAAAALAISLLAGANGCCSCAASGTFERHTGAAVVPPAAPALTPPVVRILHVGDFGEDTCQQAAVAAGIADAQRRTPFALALSVGDNLYPCGPDWRSTAAGQCTFAPDGATIAPGYTPPHDPSFREKFEAPLGALSDAGVPVYLALGNHDVSTWTACMPVGEAPAVGRAKACLEVAHRSRAWKMPARHYTIDLPEGSPTPFARIIVLDSNVVAADYGGFTLADEAVFLEAAAAGCDAIACFVAAHHPAATAGGHASDFTPAFTARMEQLVAAGGGDLRGWLSGHDHDLQHVQTAAGLDVFVSGNGARARPDERFERAAPGSALLRYGTVRWGFAILEVAADAFTWRVEDERGGARYCCAAARTGSWSPCEPVRCE